MAYAYLDLGNPDIVVVDGVGDFKAKYLDHVIEALKTLRDRWNQGQEVSQIAMHLLADDPVPDAARF
jgi:hypothetical protein